MAYQNQFQLYYTKEDWDILENLSKNKFRNGIISGPVSNVPNFRSALNSAIIKLNNNSGIIPELLSHDISTLYKKSFPIPEEAFDLIASIARKSAKPERAIIERLLIAPMFIQHYQTNGF